MARAVALSALADVGLAPARRGSVESICMQSTYMSRRRDAQSTAQRWEGGSGEGSGRGLHTITGMHSRRTIEDAAGWPACGAAHIHNRDKARAKTKKPSIAKSRSSFFYGRGGGTRRTWRVSEACAFMCYASRVGS